MPVVVWLFCNALTEMQHAAAVAATTYFVTSSFRKMVRYSAGVACAALGALMKDQLLVFLVLVCGYICWEEFRSRTVRPKGVLALPIALAAVVGSCLLLRAHYFRENVDYTLKARLLSSAAPLYDAMRPYFAVGETTISPGMVVDKALRNVRTHLWAGGEMQLFVFPFNVLAVICLLACRKSTGWERSLASISVLFICLFLLITLIYQTQFRYFVAGMPVFVCTAMLYLYDCLGPRALRRVAVVVIAAEALVAPTLVQRIYRQGVEQERIIRTIKREVDGRVPRNTALLVERDLEGSGRFVMLTYALRPRVTAVFENRGDVCRQIEDMRGYLGDRYDSLTLEAANAEPLRLPSPYSGYTLRKEVSGWCGVR
jgi:hypothetical protein